MPPRSTDATDYQDVDRPVAVMPKTYRTGETTGWHTHTRAQLLFALRGVLVASARSGAWVVPTDFALWIPPGLAHNVVMHGDIVMRSAYVRAEAVPGGVGECRVIAVSELLKAALVALADEPVLYDEAGRGGHLAALVLDEIARAPATPFALVIPADARLARLARALIADPGLALDIDGWADTVGVSRRTLTRRFRQETGLSFGAWRRRLRLLRAAARVADGEAVERVAGSLGYGSAAAFRAMARRELGAQFDF